LAFLLLAPLPLSPDRGFWSPRWCCDDAGFEPFRQGEDWNLPWEIRATTMMSSPRVRLDAGLPKVVFLFLTTLALRRCGSASLRGTRGGLCRPGPAHAPCGRELERCRCTSNGFCGSTYVIYFSIQINYNISHSSSLSLTRASWPPAVRRATGRPGQRLLRTALGS
jgi:hypothetical protein